ncbi:hypothetical protein [Alicyclobacillus sp. ALC3]|uniref:hypothetical protein n=1 Tax=Alicyclobacillus sp. ALC3 TaxID=2796143 RepID=UPI00237806E5|nr:hypothetical protein [Alicyclobacillus sp. ALC3]WDL95161.1 hypothetical protein JC200_12070 [Alicyclobacillus sp. ALC3]
MTFQEMLASFLGRLAEVAVPNQFFEGTIYRVGTLNLTLQSIPPIYGPPTETVIPYINIDYVRILVSA